MPALWWLPFADVAPLSGLFREVGGLCFGVALVVFVLAVGWLGVRYFARRGNDEATARATFLTQRPELETEFFRAASTSGKPRGLRWKACDWDRVIEFARAKQTGQLAALVGVTIQFEAIEGGDMEGLPAVDNLRNASAVFFYHRGRWHTTGKTIFNLNPDEALLRFAGQYERLF